jgi:hypothetical protein
MHYALGQALPAELSLPDFLLLVIIEIRGRGSDET